MKSAPLGRLIKTTPLGIIQERYCGSSILQSIKMILWCSSSQLKIGEIIHAKVEVILQSFSNQIGLGGVLPKEPWR